MNPSLYRNELLTKGAILGCVMLAFNIADALMLCYGGVALIVPMSLVMLLSVAAYIFLLYRFTKSYSNLVIAGREKMPFFSYGEGLLYAMNLSGLAGIVVAVGAYVFTHYVIGYDNFIDANVKLFREFYSWFQVAMTKSDILREVVEFYTNMYQSMLTSTESGGADVVESLISEIEKAEEPSIITNLFAYMSEYVMWGAIVGFVVAAKTKRNPWTGYNNFNNNENKPNNEQ